MLKLKTTILLLMISAFALTPFLVFAQAPAQDGAAAQAMFAAPITKAELDEIARVANQAKDLYVKADNGWKVAADDAKAKCAAVGAKLQALSGSVYTTIWTGPDSENNASDFTCAGASHGVIYDSHDPLIHSLLIGVMNGKVKDISAQTYAEWSKQKNANSNNPAWWEHALNIVFVTVANILASVLAGIAVMALKLLDIVVSWTNAASTPQVVYDTWGVVRDFMNLMFISALIVMALATIIRYESYNYKRLLKNLILMALLINFSQVIATTLINFSNMLIMTLKPEDTILGYARQIYPAFVTNGQGIVGGFLGQDYSFAAGLGNSVTKIFSLIFIAVSFGAIALLMLYRMIGLWFLVMVSPAAYALNILPATQGLAKRWWNEFFKFLIWGPIAMFFIKIGLTLLARGANGEMMISTSETWLNNLFIAAFIWGGFLVAKNAGMMGASQITNTADKYARNGAKFATSAYGNYFWRGSAAGHLAGAATYLGTGSKEKASDASSSVKKSFGNATAAIQTEPKRQMDRWVNKPNKARDKQVEKANRRQEIKRGYLTDLDDDEAKKFSQEDVALAIQSGTINNDSLNALMDNGKASAKNAVAEAFRQGHIKRLIGEKKIDRNAAQQAYGKLRDHLWREAGGNKRNRPADFMPDEHMDSSYAGIDTKLLRGYAKKSKNNDDFHEGTLVEQAEKTRYEVDPHGYHKARAVPTRQTAQDRGQRAQNPPDARNRGQVILTDTDQPNREMSPEERARRRREAGGIPPAPPQP